VKPCDRKMEAEDKATSMITRTIFLSYTGLPARENSLRRAGVGP
jgi:hypothetical protein